MPRSERLIADVVTDDPDYSSPEAQAALQHVTALILDVREELRDEYFRALTRRVKLYERTLGLAVIPVLIRRGFIVLGRALRGTGNHGE